ncbi:MAG TPA: hypothetical protein VH988_04020 [Thermoanaerobaculia bacterium]|nr:hypothetical protein [Thermoanaerobaculia bacterium]
MLVERSVALVERSVVLPEPSVVLVERSVVLQIRSAALPSGFAEVGTDSAALPLRWPALKVRSAV